MHAGYLHLWSPVNYCTSDISLCQAMVCICTRITTKLQRPILRKRVKVRITSLTINQSRPTSWVSATAYSLSYFLTGQIYLPQQIRAVSRMTLWGKRQAGKANLQGVEEGPPHIPWISWWKRTPLVIGVKENVSPVCHKASKWHSTSLAKPFIGSFMFLPPVSVILSLHAPPPKMLSFSKLLSLSMSLFL